MKNRTLRFLTLSVILVSLVCVLIFVFLVFSTRRKNEEALSDVGLIYMANINEQIEDQFTAALHRRVAQVESVIRIVSEGDGVPEYSELVARLSSNADMLGFISFAMLSDQMELENFYGEKTEFIDPEGFRDAVTNGNNKVALGRSIDTGDNVVLVGIPVSGFAMADGTEPIALVAGLTLDEFNMLLTVDSDSSLVHSHVVTSDGTYIIRNTESAADNYFDRIKELFTQGESGEADGYINKLRSAMEKDQDYSMVINFGAERRHIYCTSLPDSSWHLITVMPYGALDEAINSLGREWGIVSLICCAVLLLLFILIFALYFRMTGSQLDELSRARDEALSATKAKSEFLSNMSHDIRTPMNAIVGMTAIASANLDDRQQLQNCLKKISISSRHLLGLINDILDMSKIESGKMTLNMEQISLREVMDGIVNIVQPQMKAKGQQFSVNIYNIFCEEVYCDSVRINQVFLNLISNAVKFTPNGGSVQVTMYEEASDKGDNYVRIHFIVKDTGIGMTPEFKEKIFETFAREDNLRVHKTEGTGLGMPITKFIVDAMQGTINVESEQGKGTEFHVTLDLEKAQVREDEMILPPIKMLVVDDDQMMIEGVIETLKEIGINADWVLSGEEAIARVEKTHKANNDYELILLDWKLPGIDGVETARRIRQQLNDDIPILIISAYDWSDIQEDALGAGVNGFISKPLFKSTLFYGIKEYSGMSDGGEQSAQEQETFHLEGKRVLLAEDNDLNWEIAEALLTSQGLELERADNGQICLDMFTASECGYYQAVLMDIRMPVMNGYQAAEAIRATDREDNDIPIIAMTADAFSEDVKKCLESGMNAHIAKPIDINEVMKLLEKYIAGNGSK